MVETLTANKLKMLTVRHEFFEFSLQPDDQPLPVRMALPAHSVIRMFEPFGKLRGLQAVSLRSIHAMPQGFQKNLETLMCTERTEAEEARRVKAWEAMGPQGVIAYTIAFRKTGFEGFLSEQPVFAYQVS
jgi:hypothetical protein